MIFMEYFSFVLDLENEKKNIFGTFVWSIVYK